MDIIKLERVMDLERFVWGTVGDVAIVAILWGFFWLFLIGAFFGAVSFGYSFFQR